MKARDCKIIKQNICHDIIIIIRQREGLGLGPIGKSNLFIVARFISKSVSSMLMFN